MRGSAHTKLLLILILIVGVGVYFWWRQRPWPVVNTPPPAGPIIAFGDSLTAGVGAPEGADYPTRLSELIGRPVINRGVSRDTIGDAFMRLENDVLSEDPGIVIVLLGGNDYLQGNNLDEAFGTLDQMVAQIHSHGSMVLLVGVEGPLFMGGGGKRYRELARRRGTAYVPDILDGILGNRTLMSDQIHPNAAGYRMMAERIAEALRPYLE